MSTFDTRAKEWEKGDKGNIRVQNAKTIAEAIKRKIILDRSMEIIDFGVGTGLLGYEIAKEVKKVYGIDTSSKMLEEIKAKNTKELFIEPIHKDLTQEKCSLHVNGIVSSMTLHHIENVYFLFERFYEMLDDNGFIAFADLCSEDGTFHSDNTGVHHFGFEKEFLFDILKKIGYKDLDFQIINTIKKPHRYFDLFLLTARK
ncbi:MAG: class I SAM-dependent methyltransferase [Epsilonproteobacteria bacterium]|nr:class I SAM-dependent methyltransferase [Campylobacterota bacterium]